jgi:hypothetical protein
MKVKIQGKKQGAGRKLRRCSTKALQYAAQWHRTARNKIQRLKKRLRFDPTAGPAIARIDAFMRSHKTA